ncbi:MAG: ABC transporter permease [Puniceicoccales bacterium]|jgi:phospholipid/cholesterol/gamma-HCH transport system permease protein|nr:ABC transporter permease [Puniceicoccales bacterium]
MTTDSQQELNTLTANRESHGVFLSLIDYKNKLINFSIKLLSFIGEVNISIIKFVGCRLKFRKNDFRQLLQQSGVKALPIVVLISFLVGLIISFVSIIQLKTFGASIYVADLVGLAMTREMGCLMVGIIMSGRTGAAFAATIGSMNANEEIDALKTFGIQVIDFLITPRIVAMTLMMPFLCIFADFFGIIGGLIAAMPSMDITVTKYISQTQHAVTLRDILIGIIKCTSFGTIISATGCFYGLKCGRSAASVGTATTASVVASITLIILADAIYALLLSMSGI